MAANIGDIAAKVASRIKDEAGKLSKTPPLTCDQDLAILAAREEYEKRRPRERVAEINGSGVFQFQLDGGSPALPGFVDGFSSVKEIWYPYVVTDQQISKLDDDEWAVLRLPTGLFLRLLTATPASGQKVAVPYTTPHTVDVTTCTISPADDELFAALAASYACIRLAAYYAQSSDNSVPADSVQRQTEVDKYLKLAKVYRDEFEEKLGTAAADVPAIAMATIEPVFGDAQRSERFFH